MGCCVYGSVAEGGLDERGLGGSKGLQHADSDAGWRLGRSDWSVQLMLELGIRN